MKIDTSLRAPGSPSEDPCSGGTVALEGEPPPLLADVPLELIEKGICELAAHISAATYRMLCMLAEYDRRKGWAEWGCKSCVAWLTWRCGMSPSAARDHLRVAHQLQEMPEIAKAFAAGELSYSKVRALSRIASEKTEEQLLDWARLSTAAEIERLASAYRRVLSSEDGVSDRYEKRRLSVFTAQDGTVIIRARLMPEDAAFVLKAIDAAAEALATTTSEEDDGGTDPTTDPDTRWVRQDKRRADALVAMAETTLETGPSARSGGDKYQVVLYANAESLKAAELVNPQLDDGREIPVETALRLSCDASVVEVTESNGQIDTTRKKRYPSTAQRRAVWARDRHCRFPGCQQKVFMDVHHVDHYVNEGPTEPDNLALLCRYHHHLVHEGEFKMSIISGSVFEFFTPDGRLIERSPIESISSTVQELNRSIGLEIDSGTGIPLWDGHPMEMDSAVNALLTADDLLAPDKLREWRASSRLSSSIN